MGLLTNGITQLNGTTFRITKADDPLYFVVYHRLFI
jgi:hypothetical protein